MDCPALAAGGADGSPAAGHQPQQRARIEDGDRQHVVNALRVKLAAASQGYLRGGARNA
jgi:hypothetical protein